ncbi:GntR family transcriptional regulator [Mycolicibacterium canariasense]|uniref:GntR family transcriptional regulator n=1 Tax=Mycolicibacterium canariasense TaxID=228230 RepID=UPI0032D5A644
MAEPRNRASMEEVHDRLRADILAGVFTPGEKLRFAPLGSEYAASIGVLREALTRLAEQGLVVSEPRIGFRVRPLTREDLDDLTTVRIDIESLALRRAIDLGDMAWESALVAAHHTLERTPMMTDAEPVRVSDTWERAHAQFHRALVAGCGSPRLIAIAETLRNSSELYRRWSQPLDRERDVAAEHRAILDSTLGRDGNRAVAALCAHYERTAGILREALAG